MNRRPAAALAACALAAMPALLASAAHGRGDIRIPARVQVVASEFQLTLSRRTIKAGPAIVELVNFGEDPHDLYLRRQARRTKTLKIAETLPSKVRQLKATLAPGRFVLWCSIADHRRRGMEARLTVAKR